jgi:hypothetical protein
MLPSAALGADEAVRPARLLQRLLALGFGAVTLDEFVQRHAVLKLDRVLGHRRRSAGGLATNVHRLVAQDVSLPS